MIGRKAPDRLGSGRHFPTMVTATAPQGDLPSSPGQGITASPRLASSNAISANGREVNPPHPPTSRRGAHVPPACESRLGVLRLVTRRVMARNVARFYRDGYLTPPFPASFAAAPETPFLADRNSFPKNPRPRPCAFRLRPSALRMTRACSGVGNSNRRRQPSVSAILRHLAERQTALDADHLRGVRSSQNSSQPPLDPQV